MTTQEKQDKPRGLKAQIMASATLSTAEFASRIALRLVSTVVLTRLLAPEVYGVFAVVLMYLYILEMFSDIGIRPLILTREGAVDARFLRTCWTVQIGRGVVIALVSCLIALAIALGQAAGIFAANSAYAAEVLPWAIAVSGSVALIRGFASTRQFIYQREMRFGTVTACRVAENILSLVATIILAVLLRSVWALVFGAMFGALVRVVLSYVAFRGAAMWPTLDRESLGAIIDRGKWIVGHSSLTALIQMGDRIFLGFAMSSTLFGYYFIARQIMEIMDTFLNSMHAQMGLQVFTRLISSGDTAAFRRNYYRYRIVFDLLAGGFCGAMVILAPLVVQIVFDDRYAPVAPILQIIVFWLLLTGPGLVREAFSAQRRFREMTMLSLIRTVTLWAGLSIAIFGFGSTEAALFVIALHRIPEIIVLLGMGLREEWVDLRREGMMIPAVLAGAAAGWVILQLLPDLADLPF